MNKTLYFLMAFLFFTEGSAFAMNTSRQNEKRTQVLVHSFLERRKNVLICCQDSLVGCGVIAFCLKNIEHKDSIHEIVFPVEMTPSDGLDEEFEGDFSTFIKTLGEFKNLSTIQAHFVLQKTSRLPRELASTKYILSKLAKLAEYAPNIKTLKINLYTEINVCELLTPLKNFKNLKILEVQKLKRNVNSLLRFLRKYGTINPDLEVLSLSPDELITNTYSSKSQHPLEKTPSTDYKFKNLQIKAWHSEKLLFPSDFVERVRFVCFTDKYDFSIIFLKSKKIITTTKSLLN